MLKQILATFIFFTRLPLWRITDIPKEYYERVVPLWPMVGWLSGGLMAVVYWLVSIVFPVSVSVVLALLSRVLLTGALHEDGFADLCDGFGGGTTRERTLEIMKDSHIGTYGVLGLLLYYLIAYNVLTSLLPIVHTPLIFLVGDSVCKYFSSTIIYHLPYARKEAEAKNKLIYANVSIPEKFLSILLGIAPMFPLVAFGIINHTCFIHIVVASLVAFLACVQLFIFMQRRIKGYTGDCCGATFIISELVFYTTFLALSY